VELEWEALESDAVQSTEEAGLSVLAAKVLTPLSDNSNIGAEVVGRP